MTNALKPWLPAERPKTIPYWPYCQTCEQPMDFDEDEPFAHCKCGTQEWGYPRPAAYVMSPIKAKIIVQKSFTLLDRWRNLVNTLTDE